jgi:hypothetical protein
MSSPSLPNSLTKQLSAKERRDIEQGILAVAILGDQDAVDSFVEVSLLALGFEAGKRSN